MIMLKDPLYGVVILIVILKTIKITKDLGVLKIFDFWKRLMK